MIKPKLWFVVMAVLAASASAQTPTEKPAENANPSTLERWQSLFQGGAKDVAPEKPATKSAPVSVNIRTAGELAESCNVSPTNAANATRLNFCNGFAQGVIQTERQHANGTKFCFPKAPPKRSETMKEFATWVGGDAARKDKVASVAFLSFLSGRFPCK